MCQKYLVDRTKKKKKQAGLLHTERTKESHRVFCCLVCDKQYLDMLSVCTAIGLK